MAPARRRFRIEGGSVSLQTLALKDPFVTALGSKTETTNALLRLRLGSGVEGVGEASSSVVHKELSAAGLARSLRRLLARLDGRDVRRWESLAAEAWSLCPGAGAAAAAFECAALDALTRSFDIPLAEWFGGSSDRIETDMTVSALPAGKSALIARAALAAGFRTLKIKVGTGDRREDLARVLACAGAAPAPSRPRVILDGNQGFSLRGAAAFARDCLKAGVKVALFEQPLPREDLRGAALLRRRCPVPLAADESVRTPSEALAVIEAGAADVINIKLAKMGVRGALDTIALARAAGKRLMIGCMQESALGLSPSVHLACGTGAFAFADLDSDCLLGKGQPRGSFRREGPRLFLETRA